MHWQLGEYSIKTGFIQTMKNNNKWYLHVFYAATYSFSGLKWIIANETSFKYDLGLILIVFFIVILMGNVSNFGLIYLLFSSSVLLIAEITNSALERIADFICPNYDVRVKVIKDLGSASVFVAICNLVGTALILIY